MPNSYARDLVDKMAIDINFNHRLTPDGKIVR